MTPDLAAMTAPVLVCPYLGLASDRTVARTQPDTEHRCFAQTPPANPDLAHQRAYCLTADHPSCPLYTPDAARTTESAVRSTESAVRNTQYPTPNTPQTARPARLPAWLRFWPWAALAVLVIVVGVIYALDTFGLLRPVVASPAPTASPTAITQTATPTPEATEASRVRSPSPAATRFATPTPVPGGQVLTLAPRAGEAGWWTNAEARGNHLGDSFLYAGYYNGQAFIAAIRFDLTRVPRGAPIHQALLRLTGLRADRFDPAAGGVWQAQLLADDALADFNRADFQALYNTPASVSLFPTLFPADLAVNNTQTWTLDASARAWLAGQVAASRPAVIVRLIGPGSGDTLFAWDSGAGPATAGNGPQLILSLGPAPATPPPLPTEAIIVATLTPTPANVLTAAAYVRTATALASAGGPQTPAPRRIVTPTPIPANLATAQALGFARGLPPIVPATRTPANAATATADADYATAVALTTGTFTPTPTDAVTPIVILPTPRPENVLTAAARLLTATAQAQAGGTATPLPFNAIIATVTPTPWLIANTPTPANLSTAIAQAAYATAIALTTGTFTPLPPNAVTLTPTPAPPLLLYEDQMTPRPSPTPTPVAPASMPALLIGKVLFWSDRDGAPAVYALDVPSGRVALVTQGWPYGLAAQGEARAPDGSRSAVVTADLRGVPQIHIRDSRYAALRQLTATTGWSYDPAWSPRGDRIAFVSTEPGNDEIYTINADGTDIRRLTFNSWEWDKHPSWSPDGREIVFWSNRESGRRQLWIMNADGSNQRLLHVSVYNDWDPVWVKP